MPADCEIAWDAPARVAAGPSRRHGTGVFATEDMAAGDVVEVCRVLVLSPAEVADVENTSLYDYSYQWGDEGAWAFALGCGSLYNHDGECPNAEYLIDEAAERIVVTALVPIPAGTEVVVDYSCGGEHPLWFDPV